MGSQGTFASCAIFWKGLGCFADDGLIRPEHLPEEVGPQQALAMSRGRNDLSDLAHALEQFQGSRSELARHLGLSERTLYRRLKELGL